MHHMSPKCVSSALAQISDVAPDGASPHQVVPGVPATSHLLLVFNLMKFVHLFLHSNNFSSTSGTTLFETKIITMMLTIPSLLVQC